MAPRLLTSAEEQALARLIDWGRSTEGVQQTLAAGRKRRAAKSSSNGSTGGDASSSSSSSSSSNGSSGVRDDSQEGQVARMTAGRAQEVLVLYNKGLVTHMLSLLKPPNGFPRRDALQAGLTGLHTAAARFTADAGARFSTYAALWIKTAIRRTYDSQRGLVRVPDYQYMAVRHCYMHYPGLFDLSKPREEREKLLEAVKATKIFRSQNHSITLDEFDALVRGSEANSLEALEFANGGGKPNSEAGRETLGSMLSSDDLDSALGDGGSGISAASFGGAAGNGGGAGGGVGAEEGVTVEEEALVQRLLATLTAKERRAVELTMLGTPVSAEVSAQQPTRKPRPGRERKVVLRVASKELGISTEGVRQLKKRAVAKLSALVQEELAAGGAKAEELGAAVGADVSAFVGAAAAAAKVAEAAAEAAALAQQEAAAAAAAETAAAKASAKAAAAEAKLKAKRPRGRPHSQKQQEAEVAAVAEEASLTPAVVAAASQVQPPRRRTRKPRSAVVSEATTAAAEAAATAPAAAPQATPGAPAPRRRSRKPRSETAPEAIAASAAVVPPAVAPGNAHAPRRRGRKVRAASSAAAAVPSAPGFSSGVVVCNARPRWQPSAPAGGAAV